MLLQARGIVHAYAGKRALDGVDFTLRAGEVHALMGQNGAGKSTLIKVLTGAAPLQSGQISLAGRSIRPTSTQDAQRHGISTVYQEVNLCGNLSVAENIFAGRQPLKRWTRGGGIDWRGLNQRARTLLAGLDVDVDVRRELGLLPVAVQQMVAIARAIDISARVLILDEPTSSLDSDEVEKLFSAHEAPARFGHGDPVRHAFSRPGVRGIAIASPCCATAGSWANIRPPSSTMPRWSRPWWGVTHPAKPPSRTPRRLQPIPAISRP